MRTTAGSLPLLLVQVCIRPALPPAYVTVLQPPWETRLAVVRNTVLRRFREHRRTESSRFAPLPSEDASEYGLFRLRTDAEAAQSPEQGNDQTELQQLRARFVRVADEATVRAVWRQARGPVPSGPAGGGSNEPLPMALFLTETVLEQEAVIASEAATRTAVAFLWATVLETLLAHEVQWRRYTTIAVARRRGQEAERQALLDAEAAHRQRREQSAWSWRESMLEQWQTDPRTVALRREHHAQRERLAAIRALHQATLQALAEAS